MALCASPAPSSPAEPGERMKAKRRQRARAAPFPRGLRASWGPEKPSRPRGSPSGRSTLYSPRRSAFRRETPGERQAVGVHSSRHGNVRTNTRAEVGGWVHPKDGSAVSARPCGPSSAAGSCRRPWADSGLQPSGPVTVCHLRAQPGPRGSPVTGTCPHSRRMSSAVVTPGAPSSDR